MISHGFELSCGGEVGAVVECDAGPGVDRGMDGCPPLFGGSDIFRQFERLEVVGGGKEWKKGQRCG